MPAYTSLQGRRWLTSESCVLQQNVTYYCTERVTANGGPTPDTCSPVTASDISNFQTGMQACFQAAVNRGLSIAITPHLDDGLGLGELTDWHPAA